MLYDVGTKIDLSYLNPPQKAPEKKRIGSDLLRLPSGTKISFLHMAKGMTIMSIVEPPIALNVAVSV